MLILGIDSSSVSASVSIVNVNEDKKFKLIAESFTNNKLTHSITLLPMIEDMFKNSSVNLKDIDLIAVVNGPGSFTGVRIGVSLVKGLCMGLNIPVAAVSALNAAAQNMRSHKGMILSVMDARRNQFYSSAYLSNGEKFKSIFSESALDMTQIYDFVKKYLTKSIFLVGDGAELCYNNLNGLFENNIPDKIKLSPFNCRYISAASVAELGYLNYLENKTISADILAPVYLRMSQAEREKKEKENQERRK